MSFSKGGGNTAERSVKVLRDLVLKHEEAQRKLQVAKEMFEQSVQTYRQQLAEAEERFTAMLQLDELAEVAAAARRAVDEAALTEHEKTGNKTVFGRDGYKVQVAEKFTIEIVSVDRVLEYIQEKNMLDELAPRAINPSRFRTWAESQERVTFKPVPGTKKNVVLSVRVTLPKE
jgi:hypothetical protein